MGATAHPDVFSHRSADETDRKMKRPRIWRMRRIWKAIFNLLRQTDIISSIDLEDWGNSCIFARETIKREKI